MSPRKRLGTTSCAKRPHATLIRYRDTRDHRQNGIIPDERQIMRMYKRCCMVSQHDVLRQRCVEIARKFPRVEFLDRGTDVRFPSQNVLSCGIARLFPCPSHDGGRRRPSVRSCQLSRTKPRPTSPSSTRWVMALSVAVSSGQIAGGQSQSCCYYCY